MTDFDNERLSPQIHVNSSNFENRSIRFSKQEVLKILEQELSAGWFAFPTEVILIISYCVLILFGSAGNGLVCYVVARNPSMRTPRNMFITNLAISDLSLCLFAQPLNLYRLLYSEWTLGAFMCKFISMFQGTNIFVSTISITAIALDRFQVIVYPTKDSMKRIGAVAALLSIWVISSLMASPLLIFSVHKKTKPIPEVEFYYYRCYEDMTLRTEKGAYSVASMVVQYILPIIIVTVAHAKICNKLKYRMINQQSPVTTKSPYQKRKNERNAKRKRRTNSLLATIALVFALSWMPLNLFNILTEFRSSVFQNKTIDVNLAYVTCHMLVLSSACTNPVLYGWLNENFRTEFMKVLCGKPCEKMKTRLRAHPCCLEEGSSIPDIISTEEIKHNGHLQLEKSDDAVAQIPLRTNLQNTKKSSNHEVR